MTGMLLGIVILCSTLPACAEGTRKTTLAVMYFTNRGEEGDWDWLRKGFADLLITDLASCDRLLLIERERIQEILKELKVSESGVINKAVALKAARIAQVEAVLFGSYQVKGDEVEVEAHIIDLENGQLRRVEWVRGKASEVQKVEKELAERIITNLDVKLTEAERQRLKRLQTDSLDAMAHFYRGLDAYDHGDYGKAFAGFRRAVSKDRSYVNARFRVAQIYISMDEVEHGLLAYRKVLSEFPDDHLTRNMRFSYARALENRTKNYEAAIREYTKIIESVPVLDRSYDDILEERVDQKYRLDHIRELEKKDPKLSEKVREVSQAYTKWRDQRHIETASAARTLYHRAQCYKNIGDMEKAIDDIYGTYSLDSNLGRQDSTYSGEVRFLLKYWYHDYIVGTNDRIPAPSWVYRFRSEDDEYVVDAVNDPWWGNKLAYDIWGGLIFEAPPGKEFEKLYAEVEMLPFGDESYPVIFGGSYHGIARFHDTIMIRATDPKEMKYSWEKPMKPNTKFIRLDPAQNRYRFKRVVLRATFRDRKPVEGDDPQQVRTTIGIYVRPQWAQTWVNGLKTKSEVAEVRPGVHTIKVAAPGYPTKEFDVEVGDAGLKPFVSLEDDWTPMIQIAVDLHNPAMILDQNGLYRLIAEGNREGPMNLYQMISRDAVSWTEPEKLPVNSAKDDSIPKLVEGEDGTLVLAWKSRRVEEEPSVICVSTSRDGKTWTDPVIIRRHQKHWGFRPVCLWQDREGVFWLQGTPDLYRSENGRSWKLVTPAKRKTGYNDFASPSIAEDEGGLYLQYGKAGKTLRGSAALRAMDMRPGESRSYGTEWHSDGYLRLLMLPDRSVFAAGYFPLKKKRANRRGLVAVSRDGEEWSTHYYRPIAAMVWDRGSRLVCVYSYKTWSGPTGLAVSFCDINKLAGRPEENPTPLKRFRRPARGWTRDDEDRFFEDRVVYHVYGCNGRIFCVMEEPFKSSGLCEIDPDTGEFTVHMKADFGMFIGSRPRMFDSDGDHLWIATQNGGLYRFGLNDGESKWYREEDGLVSNKVLGVLCHKGEVYIGTRSGLNILDPKTEEIETITKADGMPNNSIACIAFQGDVMWLGTLDAGAIMYDPRTKEWTHFEYEPEKIGKGGPDLCSEYQSAIVVNGDSVYFPSYGLAEYNVKTKEWSNYVRGPYCNGAFADGDLLWFLMGGQGIMTLNMKTKEVLKRFVRTPSTDWYGGPNFPREFAPFGDGLLLRESGSEVTIVPKKELLRNPAPYEPWKEVGVYTRKDKEDTDK